MNLTPHSSTFNRHKLEQIWARYQKRRGPDTLEAVIVAYWPVVEKIARHLKHRLPRMVDVDDLVQEGLMGLRRAIERYDRARNVKFTTFAAWHIRGAMLDSLRDGTWEPRLVLARSRKVDEATQRFEAVHGRKPSDVELADSMGLSGHDHEAVMRDSVRVRQTSLSTMRFGSDSDRGVSCAQMQADERAIDPGQHAVAADLKELITRGFTRAERLILMLYYYENMTMKEIGATLDLSESRVSQMHSSIVKQLKAKLQQKKREFLDGAE